VSKREKDATFVHVFTSNSIGQNKRWVLIAAQVIPATIFLVLVAILGFYGFLVFRLMSKKDKTMVRIEKKEPQKE